MNLYRTIFLSFFLICNTAYSQVAHSRLFEGVVLDQNTKLPIPYATIYNITSGKGTKSNLEGKFQLNCRTQNDTILVSSIGYKKTRVSMGIRAVENTILMSPNASLLHNVFIQPKDNQYLFDMIVNCQKKKSIQKTQAKAYYELKSYIDSSQVELVESYYNLDIEGYKLEDLHFKTGRIALKKDPISKRFFTSVSSSSVFHLLDIFKDNNQFPNNPMALNTRQIKKTFYIDLKNIYNTAENDSIYVLTYSPKDTFGFSFGGELWINKTKNNLDKITMSCTNCRIHPFSPLSAADKIEKIDMDIRQSFETSQEFNVFNQTDFTYKIQYKSNKSTLYDRPSYQVETKAILYAFDYSKLFDLPHFHGKKITFQKDYSQICAFPYNVFFWKYNDENRLQANKSDNDLFFNDSNVLTNNQMFKPYSDLTYSGLHFFERPYIHWSKKRTIFQEDLSFNGPKFSKSQLYKIEHFINHVQYQEGIWNFREQLLNWLYGPTFKPSYFHIVFFLDVNKYNDSTNVLTSTIIDPSVSFCYLLMDNITHSYINMMFDLSEIARRKFVQKVAGIHDISTINSIYDNYNDMRLKQKVKYEDNVESGKNKSDMFYWNGVIDRELGINNLKLFLPYYEDNINEREEKLKKREEKSE